MTKLYGNLPIDLGFVGESINCDEMMFYIYIPIKLKGNTNICMDSRLKKYYPLIDAVIRNLSKDNVEWWNKYFYLTAKTLHVSPGCTGQRLGMHCDGFMTADINYIWYTDMPTIFYYSDRKVELPQDHKECISYLEWDYSPDGHRKYPPRSLLRLDETVIHETDWRSTFTGMRTFVKISVSDHIYALKGNSINPYLPLNVEYKERSIERNCPATY